MPAEKGAWAGEPRSTLALLGQHWRPFPLSTALTAAPPGSSSLSSMVSSIMLTLTLLQALQLVVAFINNVLVWLEFILHFHVTLLRRTRINQKMWCIVNIKKYLTVMDSISLKNLFKRDVITPLSLFLLNQMRSKDSRPWTRDDDISLLFYWLL